MSDANLRELERRFRASGTVEDEAAWLLERARAAELEQSRVEMAAYLGHPAALLGLGRAQDGRPVEDWLDDLPGHREFLQRFVLAGGAASLPAWHRDHPAWPDEHRAREAARTPEDRARQAIFGRPASMTSPIPLQDEPDLAIHAAERLIACPCADHEEEVHDLVDNATPQGLLAAQPALLAASLVAALLGQDEADRSLRLSVQEVVGNACLVVVDPGADLLLHDLNVRERRQVSRLPAGAVPNCPQVWEDVRGDVVPWLLGYSDPVRERVEARRRGGRDP